MFVEIALELKGAATSQSEPREKFWQQLRPFLPDVHTGAAYSASSMELLVKQKFPERLEAHIRQEVQSAYERINKPAPLIAMRLVGIHYGSIKPILEMTGIDGSALRDFVLSMLTIYSPIAFAEVFNAPPIAMSADVRLIQDELRLETSTTSRADIVSHSAAAGREALSRAWIIGNTSLVVPVLLAMAICYFVFTALNHELEATRSQAALAQAERVELIKALQAQNAKLAELVAAHPANNDNFKAFTDILLAVTKTASDRTTPQMK